MFEIDTDMTIHLNRGDMAIITVTAIDEDTKGDHVFQKDDVVRLTVFKEERCQNVLLQKDTLVSGETTEVDIYLTGDDTKFDKPINEETNYWYEIEVNPGPSSLTIIGYFKDGAKILTLYPEGDDSDDD